MDTIKNNKEVKRIIHGMIFIPSVFILCVAVLFMYIELKWMFLYCILFSVVGLCFFIHELIVYITTIFIIDNDKYYIITGLFSKKYIEISEEKRESFYIKQSLLGLICKFGTLHIIGTGNSNYCIHYLKKTYFPVNN